MMGYWGSRGMMDWGSFGTVGALFSIFWIVVLVDLILLGLWLYRQLKKK